MGIASRPPGCHARCARAAGGHRAAFSCPLPACAAGTVTSSPSPAGALVLSASASLKSCGCAGSAFSELAPNCLCLREPQLLLEALDLERLLAHQRLQCRRIVRQIGSAWRCRLGHASIDIADLRVGALPHVQSFCSTTPCDIPAGARRSAHVSAHDRSKFRAKSWSGQRDSNPRPPAPKAGGDPR